MSNKPIKELATIMFTDIVGYTELTSASEEEAFNLIKRKRELLLPLLKKHSGYETDLIPQTKNPTNVGFTA